MKLTRLFFLLSLLISISCETNTDPAPEDLLESAGFAGTLPNGSEFGNSSIASSNGVIVLGTNQVYTGSHILSLRNLETSWSISLELPPVTFSSVPPLGENNGEDLEQYFLENYSYETILQKLNAEKQKATEDANYSSLSNFRVTVTNQAEFYAYLHDDMTPAEAGKLRILEVTEGIQKDQQGQDVRKIEVLVSMDIRLKSTDENVNPQSGSLKGQGLFKFREDFHQGN